ncbi:50S ribosomal protein L25/general stress protein Ctc [Lysobacter soyae]|uniref:Large ribosomal subunit protein bL25 n=1 Tax=Lysobacter soyae TaxID=2764185 RepID=A0ABX8WRT1_9GAMM|nr:50S ribosomal protein L25/general stress protein Ctc [Lysobacter sp. CJ11]QYR53537.1 50S ribosomal protein L25/general stress protein Ctc [Lysobacter sp. CJ11]
MATEHKIKAYGRKDEGKGASRRLRHAGRTPAVVYGGDAAPQSIEVEHEPLWLAQQNDWFYSSIISLEIDGKVESVLLRDMQRHPYKQLVMHLDFQRVKAGEKLHTRVPLHFINIEDSPAGKNSEVSVTSELNDVEVTCLPKDLPEFIEVDLSKINTGDTVHLSDVKLPKGVELVHPIDEAHNPAVAVARLNRTAAADEAADEAAAAEATAEAQSDAEGDAPAAEEGGEA